MTAQPKINKAVIYCRVSSPKQVKEGHGLQSQETRCREYAKHKGYEVIEVFKDEGITGKLLDRPNIQNMLTFLKQHKRERFIVIIDDISRLARDIETHIKLRSSITEAGGKLESPSIEFGEDSDSRLVEHLLASVAAHQREKNTEQVKNRMRARALGGYWVFPPPVGYRFARKAAHGKIMVPDEPVASILKEALEGFASGRFANQTEFKDFLQSKPAFPNKNAKGHVHMKTVKDILERPLYAGYISIPVWDIKLHPAKHEPLISFETWHAIQKRLKNEGLAPARKDIHKDFPLRGYVTCGCCGKPYTSCWSKGTGGHYAYYLCQNKECAERGKSIPKKVIEDEFEKLLAELRPSPELFYTAAEIFSALWDHRRESSKEEIAFMKKELLRIERKGEQFMDRITESESINLIVAYENKIEKLEEDKLLLNEKIKNCGRPLASFDETFRTAIDFLGNPQKIWAYDNIESKRLVLRLAFSEKLSYHRNEGFRTPAKALPFELLDQISDDKFQMVPPVRLELTLPKEPDFESGASTNSATGACDIIIRAIIAIFTKSARI